MTYLILYFLAGILQDFLVTLNWRYVTEKKPILATLFSFLATIVSLTVLYNILTRLDVERGLIAILVYSAGVGLGTFFGMKFKPGFKD
jgi:uncharacterized protein YebE (UPF0316 family)